MPRVLKKAKRVSELSVEEFANLIQDIVEEDKLKLKPKFKRKLKRAIALQT